MKRTITFAISLALVLAASAPGSMALAHGMSGNMGAGRMTGPGYEVTAEMQRFREMAGLMRDMSQQMNKDAGEHGERRNVAREPKRMQQQLMEMSDMMTGMAGLADRPSMNDPELKKQTDEMRQRMGSMLRAQP